jgi:hypothetical protein
MWPEHSLVAQQAIPPENFETQRCTPRTPHSILYTPLSTHQVKEMISLLPHMAPPEQLSLWFAGRLLQDRYTLGEYNIQVLKPLNLNPKLPRRIQHTGPKAPEPKP